MTKPVAHYQKHDRFAIEHKFTNAQQYIWRTLRRLYSECNYHLIDTEAIAQKIHQDFNITYDRKTYRTAIALFIDIGLIVIVGDKDVYKARYKYIYLHSIDSIGQEIPERDPFQDKGSGKAPKMVRSKKTTVKQQQLIDTKQLCKSNGINFREDRDWYEIASHGLEKIGKTIKLLKLRACTGDISNPLGWFRIALRRNFYLDWDGDTPEILGKLADKYLYIKERLSEAGIFPAIPESLSL